ncbi:MAG: hypothetical protein KDK39_17370, partial [Leptospiraceae bacterium]|nr:hypothetical protein [Leptospiraceae bacterium]
MDLPVYEITEQFLTAGGFTWSRALLPEQNKSVLLLSAAHRNQVRDGYFRQAWQNHQNFQNLKAIPPAAFYKDDGGEQLLALEDPVGINLAVAQRQKRLAVQDILQIAFQLLDVLEHLHQQNTIAGPLHPAWFSYDLKSKTIQCWQSGLWQTPAVCQQEFINFDDLQSTWLEPAYIAPEHSGLSPFACCPASDYFCLGSLLFELLTGKPAFQGSSMTELIDSLLDHEPPG